jgi:murein L,D-transpeptidase YafK
MLLIQKPRFLKTIFLIACVVLPWNATAVNHGSLTDQLLSKKFGRNLVESLLVKSLLEITEGQTKQAFGTVNELIRAAPNFKLAYLIRGDLLTAQGRPLQTFGDSNTANPDNTPSGEEIKGLRDEARTRIDYYLSEKKTSQQPNLLVKLSDEQEHLIVVDTAKSRLFLYKKMDGALQYVADYYVTVGKNGVGKQTQGDKRTPLGVYFAGQKLTQPLADIYGDAAYPLNYPNELDQHQSKNGSGIWLHGTPTDTYSRPPRASDGCVVLSNPDLKALAPILQTGKTPVIIVDNLEWLSNSKSNEKLETQEAEKQALQKAIEDWRKDWVSQNTDNYLKHYSKKFFYSEGGFSQWADYKRGIQAAKPKVSIQIEDISMFGYPALNQTSVPSQPIIVVNFEQDFKSQALQNKMHKRQYWVNENNQWKIIYEGAG